MDVYADKTIEDSDDEKQVSQDVEVEADEDVLKRISMVEGKVLDLLNRETGSDKEAFREKSKPEKLPLSKLPHSFPCSDTYRDLPSRPPKWPQRPVMLTPTPYTFTKIKGIRRASGTKYKHFPGFCAGCILPINNGCEKVGESLVIDFESKQFVGSLLMRIKQAPANNNVSHSDQSCYFDGKKRKFQAVVKGRFKSPLPMSQCVTGQTFERPAGKLPARWVVSSFVKFIAALAPQLEATLDGDKPRFLSPLVATAQTVLAKPRKSQQDDFPQDLEEELEEPSSLGDVSVMGDVQRDLGLPAADNLQKSVAKRMKTRKKCFNAIAARKEKSPRFSTEKEYTFEFYQHLLDFKEELAVDMVRPIGKVGLAQATDGQPIKFMSAYHNPVTKELDTLWSFDIWHESLFPYAELALGGSNNDE